MFLDFWWMEVPEQAFYNPSLEVWKSSLDGRMDRQVLFSFRHTHINIKHLLPQLFPRTGNNVITSLWCRAGVNTHKRGQKKKYGTKKFIFNLSPSLQRFICQRISQSYFSTRRQFFFHVYAKYSLLFWGEMLTRPTTNLPLSDQELLRNVSRPKTLRLIFDQGCMPSN